MHTSGAMPDGKMREAIWQPRKKIAKSEVDLLACLQLCFRRGRGSWISLIGFSITDQGLSQFRVYPNLRFLELTFTKVTTLVAKWYQKSPHLQSFALYEISDEDLCEIAVSVIYEH